jgi:hypothetical protein
VLARGEEEFSKYERWEEKLGRGDRIRETVKVVASDCSERQS